VPRLNRSQDTNSLGVAITDRTCLIMDEVDGMSAGDRGGVGALNAMIKKTKVRQLKEICDFGDRLNVFQVPIICIANDRQAQKLKPLMATTFSLTFNKSVV
jgi:replication factor C subunit 1